MKEETFLPSKVDLSFPKSSASLFALEKQSEDIAKLKEEAIKLASVSGFDYVEEAFEEYARKWEEALGKISSLAKEGKLEEAMDELSLVAKTKVEVGLKRNFQSEAEASLIAKSLRCRLEAMLIKKQLKEGQSCSEAQITNHYYSCLALPDGLEGKTNKSKLIDEARGFVYGFFAGICLEQGEDYKTFTASLPHWKMALEDTSCSPSTRKEKERFASSFASCFNRQSERLFSLERDYERALELFRLRELVGKENLTLPPYRYAYDENEFRLYFGENEALSKEGEDFISFVTEISSKIDSSESFEFRLLSHLLSLQGISKERFAAMMVAIKPLSFELKIQLLSSSLALGMAPLRAQEILRSIEKTHPKTLDLESNAKSLLFIKEHLNDALLARFNPLLEEILRSPKAHKVIVKSHSLALHTLAGEDASLPRLSLGKGMKNTRVGLWGRKRLASYIAFGIILPILLLLGVFSFIYLNKGISANRSSVYELITLFGMLMFVFITLDIWAGFDERPSALTRRILLADALWKGALGMLYFILPSAFPILDRVRYAFLGFAFIESFLSFFLLKPLKGKAALDYFLFGATFSLSMVGIVFMVLDMIKGLV